MIKASSNFFECIARAWEKHEAELLTFLIHKTGNIHTAEDLLQEVFLKSMKQGKQFCSLNNPRAWLFQVARNTLIDVARTAKPHDPLPDDLPAMTADEREPVDQLDQCIDRNLSSLSQADHHIIMACDLEGQTVNEYARMHNLTLAAAKSRLLRARQRLRQNLIKNCHIQFDDNQNVCCHRMMSSQG